MNITEQEWLAVYGKLGALTKAVKGVLFNAYRWKWLPSDEYVRECAWDQTLKRLESYEPGPASPATYVQKYVPKDVVRRLVREYHEWQARVDVGRLEETPDPGETPDQACAKNDLVEAALETVPDDDREALLLFAEGYTLEEIGEKLGVGASAVFKRLRKYNKNKKENNIK